ncbi:MAG: DUF1127 domain-containing protein [Pseudomonadota bacterium]
MASITNRPLSAGTSVFTVLAGLVGKVASWNDARVTRAALSKLSDHELNDLGLIRGDIDNIAAGNFNR